MTSFDYPKHKQKPLEFAWRYFETQSSFWALIHPNFTYEHPCNLICEFSMGDFHSQIRTNVHGWKAEFLWNKVHPWNHGW